jgi:ribosomal protein S18 acetylase RimI-like enzyme
MITIKTVTEFAELEGIKELQQKNLRKNLTTPEAEAEGFVTAEYSLAFLQTLHASSPSVIAKDGDEVVAYALAALKSVRHQHDLLADLFSAIDKIEYRGRLLNDSKYVVVGQLCVARNYRGMGLVKQIYQAFKKSLYNEFDYCITDVAIDNPRSLKAHEKSGFRVIDTLNYGGISWQIILWDWTLN